MKIDRRTFLAGSVAAASLAGCATAKTGLRPLKEGERRTMALIGCGLQMRYLSSSFIKHTPVDIVAVCDCDKARAAAMKAHVDGKTGGNCRIVEDFRDIIKDPFVDTVCIATPDHWHAYMCVEAMKHGKDVYCEKPLTWSVGEAVEVMKAEKKYARVFQTGSMQRSWREFRDAVAIVRGGAVGEVKSVDANFGTVGALAGGPSQPMRFWYKPEEAEKEGAPNPDVDWDMWLGPAKRRPYSDRLAPRGVFNGYPMFWRCDDDLANGMCGDWGAHQIDIALWGLCLDESGPVKVMRSKEPYSANPLHGGRRQFGARMLFNTPSGEVLLVHGPFDLVWGTVFYATDGIVAVNRGRIAVWKGTGLVKPTPEVRRQIADCSFMPEKRVAFSSGKGTPALDGALDALEKRFAKEIAASGVYFSDNHYSNFIDCVETRRRTVAPASTGARTAIACQLLNACYKYDTCFAWDPEKFEFAAGSGRGIELERASSNGWETRA